jgi:hypothetical protein
MLTVLIIIGAAEYLHIGWHMGEFSKDRLPKLIWTLFWPICYPLSALLDYYVYK